jgi:uncharacterized small protein (DUF1192 family)
MARALMGHVGNAADQVLAYEVARLRRRVAELEAEIGRLRAAQDGLEAHGSDASVDLELHRLTEQAEPALA